jgi:hypothetical protein
VKLLSDFEFIAASPSQCLALLSIRAFLFLFQFQLLIFRQGEGVRRTCRNLPDDLSRVRAFHASVKTRVFKAVFVSILVQVHARWFCVVASETGWRT